MTSFSSITTLTHSSKFERFELSEVALNRREIVVTTF